MEFAFYQRFKDEVVLAAYGLPHDVFHLLIGPVVCLLTAALARRPLSWWPALLPGFLLSLAMEVMDLSYTYSRWHWLSWRESLWDILITNAGPVLIWLAARHASRRRAPARPSGTPR